MGKRVTQKFEEPAVESSLMKASGDMAGSTPAGNSGLAGEYNKAGKEGGRSTEDFPTKGV